MKRGEIYYADLSPAIGSEQGGVRPVVILQNDVGNKFAPTTIVAPITSRTNKKKIPTHHWFIDTETTKLLKHSQVLLEQVRVVNKTRLKSYVGKVSEKDQKEIDKALAISVGLVNIT